MTGEESRGPKTELRIGQCLGAGGGKPERGIGQDHLRVSGESQSI